MAADTSPPLSPHDHQSCAADALKHAEAVCEGRNRRLTENRRAVLKLLLDDHRAIGAYEIIRRFDWGGRIPAPVQVYRALDFLESMGLVHRIASRNAYVACYRLAEQHDGVLFVCRACGVVTECEGLELGSLTDELARQSGFTVQVRLLEAVGVCRDCARAADRAGSGGQA